MRKKIIGRPVEDFECGCGDCKDCECDTEMDDQEVEEIKMLVDFTGAVIDANGCFDCTYEIIDRIYNIGKSVGWNDNRDAIREILDDLG